MIKITVNPDKNPHIHLFSKQVVVIGSGLSAQADLKIEDDSLQDVHLIIEEINGRFLLINKANDPFATVNGQPFGKKDIGNQDIIYFGKTTIKFEGQPDAQPANQKVGNELYDTESKLVDLLDDVLLGKIQASRYQSFMAGKEHDTRPAPLDLDAEMRELEELVHRQEHNFIHEEELTNLDIEALVHEVEQLEWEEKVRDQGIIRQIEASMTAGEKITPISPLGVPSTESHAPRKEMTPKFTLKDLHMPDSEDEHDGIHGANERPYSNRNLRLLAFFFIALLLIVCLLAGVLYLSYSGKSGEEESRAAKGLSDVSMALTHAQINRIKPQKHSWSDPEFLKANLHAVLASQYPSFAMVDAQGHFLNSPYILRIYTNTESTRFLAIAQPDPSLLQWLLPKATIVVDSDAMELRKIYDVKTLNRLLVNANTLDGPNGVEISRIAKEGELIPLASLGRKSMKYGLVPPKALALLRPGSENLIYNAPRYYLFGEKLLDSALGLLDASGTGRDVDMLREEAHELAKLPNLVLYSSKGIRMAMKAQRAMTTLLPSEKFMIAYLKFNSEGNLHNTLLIMENDSTVPPAEILNLPFEQDTPDDLALNTSSYDDNEEKKDNSIYLQFLALAKTRQQALQHCHDEIISLLRRHLAEGGNNFASLAADLLDEYQKIDRQEQEHIVHSVVQITQDHPDLSIAQVITALKQAGIEAIVHDNLSRVPVGEDHTEETIQKQFESIHNARTLDDLAEQTLATTALLNLETVSDLEQLAAYQTEMRTRVLHKLDELFLSPSQHMEFSNFKEENRIHLINILKSAWITDSDIKDFYHHEFEELVRLNA